MKPATVKIGETFGRLTVIEEAGRNKYWKQLYQCKCVCGKEVIVEGCSLSRGATKSCGCLHIETAREQGKRNRTHGESFLNGSPEYNSWLGIKGRCYNQNNNKYPIYGGRGITVCQKWRDSFETFLVDVGRRPSPKHSLDRIDTNGNYEPGNVKWSTPKEQQRNKRNNRYLTAFGKTQTLVEWAEETGLSARAIHARLNRFGWDEEKSVSTPVETVKTAHILQDIQS